MTDEVKYERKCKNWLETYVNWTRPRCESPDTYILWSGLFALSSALRRHVKVPREQMGGWEIAPNLYIIFVAPPGRARKSTTIGFSADEILGQLQRVTRSPTIVTQAALLKLLAESDDASVYIASHEFSSVIMKSKIEMFEFLTDLFDGKKHIEASTISRAIDFVERPCANLLAATTPRWIVENMPESVIGGGFASRVIFIYEDRVRRRQLYYKGLNHLVLDGMRDNLINDLQHIADNINGDFKLTEEAESFMMDWYNENAEVDDADYRLSGYLERRPAHIHKVAMLLAISESDRLLLDEEHFVKAIYLLEQVEKKLPQVFRDIGNNPHAPTMSQIKDAIEIRGRVKKQELRRMFGSAAQPRLLDELIQGLMDMDEIHYDNKGSYVTGPYIPPAPIEDTMSSVIDEMETKK